MCSPVRATVVIVRTGQAVLSARQAMCFHQGIALDATLHAAAVVPFSRLVTTVLATNTSVRAAVLTVLPLVPNVATSRAAWLVRMVTTLLTTRAPPVQGVQVSAPPAPRPLHV